MAAPKPSALQARKSSRRLPGLLAISTTIAFLAFPLQLPLLVSGRSGQDDRISRQNSDSSMDDVDEEVLFGSPAQEPEVPVEVPAAPVPSTPEGPGPAAAENGAFPNEEAAIAAFFAAQPQEDGDVDMEDSMLQFLPLEEQNALLAHIDTSLSTHGGVATPQPAADMSDAERTEALIQQLLNEEIAASEQAFPPLPSENASSHDQTMTMDEIYALQLAAMDETEERQFAEQGWTSEHLVNAQLSAQRDWDHDARMEEDEADERNVNDDGLPKKYICPLSMELMEDPVCGPDKHLHHGNGTRRQGVSRVWGRGGGGWNLSTSCGGGTSTTSWGGMAGGGVPMSCVPTDTPSHGYTHHIHGIFGRPGVGYWGKGGTPPDADGVAAAV